MKGSKDYFRHSFHSNRDNKIKEIQKRLGRADGYYYFFTLLEYCGVQAEVENNEDFYISIIGLKEYWGVKYEKKAVKIMANLHDSGLIFIEGFGFTPQKPDEKEMITCSEIIEFFEKKSGANIRELSQIDTSILDIVFDVKSHQLSALKGTNDTRWRVPTQCIEGVQRGALEGSLGSACIATKLINFPKYLGKYSKKVPNKRKENKIKENKSKYIVNENAKSILEYLNEKTGRNFKTNIDSNYREINARLKNYSVQEIKQVIDKKVLEWSHDETMNKYLRPSTLFRVTNFENYVTEKSEIETNNELKETWDKYEK